MARLAALAMLFALLWLVIAGTDPTAWLIGVPAVAAAVWARQRLSRPGRHRPRLTGLLTFAPFFLCQSMRGGLDVARRTLAPRLRIAPGFIDWHTRLPGRAEQVFFTNCVSLLPGTLAADFVDGRLRVHLLDAGVDPGSELTALEEAVARVYGVTLPAEAQT
jgi:multicomponent Na+:H+ antiporter subunit E